MNADLMEAIGLCAVLGFVLLPGSILIAANVGMFLGHGTLMPWVKYIAILPQLLRYGCVGAVLMPLVMACWD